MTHETQWRKGGLQQEGSRWRDRERERKEVADREKAGEGVRGEK